MATMSERRAQILEAAERLLEGRGWQKTTVADIAREAQVAVGSVYLEFSSKTLIMRELSHSKYDTVLRAMRRAAMSEGSFEARLERMMLARAMMCVEIARGSTHTADFIQCSCEGVREAVRSFEEAQRELLIDFLSAAHQSGAFHLPSPALTAEALLVAYARFEPAAIIKDNFQINLTLLREVHRLTVRGLSARA